MKHIDLDASTWETALDVYEARLRALDAPMGHGRSVDALADSMIWTNQMNEVKPPYRVRIVGTRAVAEVVRQEIAVHQERGAEKEKRHLQQAVAQGQHMRLPLHHLPQDLGR